MATNIGTIGTLVTVNMKPVPDEQVDALWGQNIGDCIGALWETERMIACGAMSFERLTDNPYGTFYYRKSRALRNVICGTITGHLEDDAAGLYQFTLYADGNWLGSVTLDDVTPDVDGFTFDASAFTNNAVHEIAWVITTTSASADRAAVTFSVFERP